LAYLALTVSAISVVSLKTPTIIMFIQMTDLVINIRTLKLRLKRSLKLMVPMELKESKEHY
jgi:hypothetical protein